jgi:putative endonuclease
LSSATPESTHSRGAEGEELAARFLEGSGYRILSRNWRHHRGELDLVARDPDGTIAFVEVKTARGVGAGDPGEWITPAKQRKLSLLALAWMVRHEATGRNVRFDAVLLRSGRPPEHVVDAFRPEIAGF